MTDKKICKKYGRKTVAGDEIAMHNLAKLQAFREQEGLSQKKLAQLSGVSDKTILRIELHHVQLAHVSVLSYVKLAAFFGWGHDYAYENAQALVVHNPEEETRNFDWEVVNNQTLKVNASRMYHMLEKIASERDVWTVGEVKRLLSSVSKGSKK